MSSRHNLTTIPHTTMATPSFLLCLTAVMLSSATTTTSPTTQFEQPFPPARLDCANDSAIVDMLLAKHDRNRLPSSGVVVHVELWVQEISKIIEQTSEFELDIYMTERWLDQSLSFQDFNPCKQNISLDGGSLVHQLWGPNCCFVNSKNATIHASPVENIFLMIYSNGTVCINYRMKLVGPCEKDLKTFPVDKQRCSLTYESFTYTNEQVSLRWVPDSPVLVLGQVNLPDYYLVNYTTVKMTRDYLPGRWDELTVTFTFQRLYGFYVLQVYLPSYLTVFISWISFYLGSQQIPSRTIIGLNSLLSLTFQFSSIASTLPRSSDLKAIDVWILSCMAFIFFALLELAIVGFMVSRDSYGKIECQCGISCFKCPVWTPEKLDRLSAVAFPTFFSLFNLYYYQFFIRTAD